MPKELQDTLIDATVDSEEGRKRFTELARQIALREAWRRFDEAIEKVAAEIDDTEYPFDDPLDYENAVVIESRP